MIPILSGESWTGSESCPTTSHRRRTILGRRATPTPPVGPGRPLLRRRGLRDVGDRPPLLQERLVPAARDRRPPSPLVADLPRRCPDGPAALAGHPGRD